MKLRDLITEIVYYKIYCDMDGVLTDFPAEFKKLVGVNIDGYEEKHGSEQFWGAVEKGGLEFWSKMAWMSDGKKLWNYIKNKDVEILSAPSRSIPNSPKGKKMWVSREVSGTKLNLVRATAKQKFANGNAILIDDMKKNVDQWKSAGGIGILHKSASDTIRKLKQLGI